MLTTTRTHFQKLSLASLVASQLNERDFFAIVIPDAWPPTRGCGGDVYVENSGCVNCYTPSYALTIDGPICKQCASNEGVLSTRHVTRAPQQA